MDFGTKAIHLGIEPDPTTGAIMTPIYQTSTFVQHAPGEPYRDKHGQIYEYARTHNPTRLILERNLAPLEAGNLPFEDVGALCFASGLGATDVLMRLLRYGDQVVKGDDLYGGSHRLFDNVHALAADIQFTAVDMTNLKAVKASLTPKTKMVWLETPTNPMLNIADIEAVGKIIKAYNPKILYAVDNTFSSPYLQTPLEIGADIVVHSLTKYVGGHSDLVMGAIVCKKNVLVPYQSEEVAFPAYTKNEAGEKVKDLSVYAQLQWLQNSVGCIPGILDCFLALRGIKTLHLRMKQHCENAAAVAEVLKGHPAVESVYYPGLREHPNHEIAKKQMRGFGGMVSLRLKEDTMEGATKFMKALQNAPRQVFKIAESLGGVESMVNHPVTMTHGAMKFEERQRLGISVGLVRLSVGVEGTNDIVEDVKYALEMMKGGNLQTISP